MIFSKEEKTSKKKLTATFSDKLITDAVAKNIISSGTMQLKVNGRVIITPSARDTLKHTGVKIEICNGGKAS